MILGGGTEVQGAEGPGGREPPAPKGVGGPRKDPGDPGTRLSAEGRPGGKPAGSLEVIKGREEVPSLPGEIPEGPCPGTKGTALTPGGVLPGPGSPVPGMEEGTDTPESC